MLVKHLFARTGVQPAHLQDSQARISYRQRLSIYRNARTFAKHSDVALRAGARQRISDYGIYGYAMVSSSTFGEALEFSLERIAMAGPVVMQISLRVEDNTAILRSHGTEPLGDLLPFAAELWRSSMTSLFSRVLEAPFPAKRMVFPFAPPLHWRNYSRMFNCPVDFSKDTMEWHFDASILNLPCPNANPITAQVCQQFCDVVLAERPGESDLVRFRHRADLRLNVLPQFFFQVGSGRPSPLECYECADGRSLDLIRTPDDRGFGNEADG